MEKYFCCFRGGESSQRQSPQGPPQQQAAQDPPQQQVLIHPGITFPWVDILNGTHNFLESNLLGEGNFGRVYRFSLPRFNAIGAAKIQKDNYKHAKSEFKAEIKTLERANHPNVIQLLGKYKGRGSLCVVYEFMRNGSLDHHLFGRGQQEVPCLDWNRRVRIALGVAEALVYLHNVLKMIHRDVKSANVLLDENFAPKLTDFGLATKMFIGKDGVERESIVTPNMGTLGFVAPETRHTGFVSSKSDVYGYGIFLFELITGKKAHDPDRPLATIDISDWLKSERISLDDLSRVIDVKLGNRYSVEGLKGLFQAASMCIGPRAARPSMDVVEYMVRQALAHLVPETTTVST